MWYVTFGIGFIRYPNKLFSNPCIPGQLILDKDVKIIQKGNNFSTDTLETHAQKNWGGESPTSQPTQKLNYKEPKM